MMHNNVVFFTIQIPMTLIMKFYVIFISLKKILYIFYIVFHYFSSRTKSKNG